MNCVNRVFYRKSSEDALLKDIFGMQTELPSFGSGSDCSSDTDITVYMDYQSEPETNTPEIENNDFSEYLWMENEEAFDEEVIQRLTEEELMEECEKAVSEDEKRNVKFTRLLERLNLVDSDETREQGDRIVLTDDNETWLQFDRLQLTEDNEIWEQLDRLDLRDYNGIAQQLDRLDLYNETGQQPDRANLSESNETWQVIDRLLLTNRNKTWQAEIAGQSTLNPNAAEFVPAFKSAVTSVSTPPEVTTESS
ncbi:polyA-binding protein interacting protein 2 isoform X2 [Nomia melanderi]|uniref:polyA-binding protein interacting protein 2 isoform X2 n=1 Tax=Nomia melanderi TaxID=2448451 RepID=UPI0013043358|nr:uncharacterized protein LOC116431354 isoform X2 [Nomia melanderi]